MKRTSLLLLLLVTTVVLLAPPSLAAAKEGGPAPKASGNVVSEVLTGDLIGIRTMVFNAQGTLTEAKGHISFTLAWPPTSFLRTFEGEVTGFWQEGNRAAFRGVMTAQTGYSADDPPTHFAVRVEDNGQGSKATGPDRFMSFFGWTEADDEFLTDWEAAPWPFSTYWVPVTSGNLVVH